MDGKYQAITVQTKDTSPESLHQLAARLKFLLEQPNTIVAASYQALATAFHDETLTTTVRIEEVRTWWIMLPKSANMLVAPVRSLARTLQASHKKRERDTSSGEELLPLHQNGQQLFLHHPEDQRIAKHMNTSQSTPTLFMSAPQQRNGGRMEMEHATTQPTQPPPPAAPYYYPARASMTDGDSENPRYFNNFAF